MTKEQATDYLEKVLNDWNTWREHHELLCKAIEVVLEEIKGEEYIPNNLNNS